MDNPFGELEVTLQIPDLWQAEAARLLREGTDVIVHAPTGAGKTRVFELVRPDLAKQGQLLYTVPTRALANDKRAEWQADGKRVGIATGDIAEDLEADVVVATLEAAFDQLTSSNPPALLVIDEYQMISHPRRGSTYEAAIALAPPNTRLLLLSGSVENTNEVADWLTRLDRKAKVVYTRLRPVPLEEMPFAGLPYHPPKSLSGGFWPKFVAAALMNKLGPLLIFATKRREAEKIARAVVNSLPAPDPITLTHEQEAACGKTLARLITHRVAYHHSGLSFAARAGVIEPLAKAGQLRLVVATTGLAAGVNFSMRSVAIAGWNLYDGETERDLFPDELLQMFGRAGRRGLDEEGTVLSSGRWPRLADASRGHLHRSGPLSWSTLLRAMDAAASRDEDPFDAARQLCADLFSEAPLRLGIATGHDEAQSEEADFSMEAMEEQSQNSLGEWELTSEGESSTAHIAEARVWKKGKLHPATQVASTFDSLPQLGRLTRSETEETWQYAREFALASQLPDGTLRPTKNLAKKLRLPRNTTIDLPTLTSKTNKHLSSQLPGWTLHPPTTTNDRINLLATPDHLRIPVWIDSHGIPLASPQTRAIRRRTETSVFDHRSGTELAPRDGSPAHTWRKLGLIEPDGTPTERGWITSRFQGGEGLAIAAALEDTTYAVEDLCLHLANLRAGSKFTDMAAGSDRLAATCHAAYGTLSYPGYLSLGLPPTYGEGASEVLELYLDGKRPARLAEGELGTGDIERALVEWLSLLRHLRTAPGSSIPRWAELKAEATRILTVHGDRTPSAQLPKLPPEQTTRRPNHRLFFK